MTRPTDIPEWAWAEAVRCAETVCRNLDYDDCTVEITAIARALMAAEAREREACAFAAEKVGSFGDCRRDELTANYGQPRYDLMHAIIAAIRKRGA